MNMEISFPGGKRVDAQYKGFCIKTDQPANSGGENTAPSPFDLFLTSLGTCAGYYVLSFCEKRGIFFENIKLILNSERNAETHMVENINIEIVLPDDFPEKYKSAVINSAELCAVKKHLHNPPKFNIYVGDGS